MFSLLKKYPDNHTLGPLLITIGPNCSGKTEFIKSLGEDVQEFSNDNIHGLYERIPIGLAAAVWCDKITGDVIQALKNQKSSGKPLMERLKEQKESELVYLTLYYARLITLEEVTAKLRKILPTAEYFDGFIEVITEIKQMMKSKTIDLFVPEVVESGVAGLVTAVKAAIKSDPGVICWGNNNVEPVYYKEILHTCLKYKRVVRFVRWGQELPTCSLKELFKRSILRLLRTGRYVESFEIAKNWAKAELFFKECHSGSHTDIVRLSDYFLDINGTLCPLSQEYKPRKVTFDSTKWSDWTNVGRVYNLRKRLASQTSKSVSAIAAAADAANSVTADNSTGGGVSPAMSVSVDSEVTNNSRSSSSGSGKAALKPSALLASTAEGEDEDAEEEKDDFDFTTLSVSLPVSMDLGDAGGARGSGSAGGKAPLLKDDSQASVLLWDAFYESRTKESATAAGAATAASKPQVRVSFYEQKPEEPVSKAPIDEPASSTAAAAAPYPLFDYFAFKESAISEPKVEEKQALPDRAPDADGDVICSTQVQTSDGGWCVILNFQSLFAL